MKSEMKREAASRVDEKGQFVHGIFGAVVVQLKNAAIK